MKIRNGFVSNSSSSSFIIAINSDVEAEVDFEGEGNNGKIVKGKIRIPGTTAYDIEDLKKLFKWEFNFDIDEAMKPENVNKKGYKKGISNFEKCKKALEEGKYIIGFGDLMGGETWEPNGLLNEGDEEEVDLDAMLYNNGGIEVFANKETMDVIAEEYGNGVV